MSASQLSEHSGYLGDQHKLAAYEQALGAVLQSGDQVVLDLGAGTGILGLLAARAGARRIYAVDSGSILGPAAETAAALAFAERIVHIRGRSTDIELPELVDVAVCDQIGGFVHDAGVLQYFADARKRLMAPDGVLVPAGFRMFLAPAECSSVRDQIDLWASSPAGFDFSTFGELSVNTEHRTDGDKVCLLSPGVEVANIASDHTQPIKGSGTATITVEGRCDGLVGFFEAEMGGGVALTNDPSHPQRMRRWCNFYPISAGIAVGPGHTVAVHVDVRPRLGAVTWRVEVRNENGEVLTNERHSTLLGKFLAADDLKRSGGSTIRVKPVGEAVALALRLADGTRTTAEVLAATRAEVPDSRWSPTMDETLRTLLERFTTPHDPTS